MGSWILFSALLNIFLLPITEQNPTMCPASNYICSTFYLFILACYFLKNMVGGDYGFGDYNVFNQDFATDKQLGYNCINSLKNTRKVECALLKSLRTHTEDTTLRQKFKLRGAC